MASLVYGGIRWYHLLIETPNSFPKYINRVVGPLEHGRVLSQMDMLGQRIARLHRSRYLRQDLLSSEDERKRLKLTLQSQEQDCDSVNTGMGSSSGLHLTWQTSQLQCRPFRFLLPPSSSCAAGAQRPPHHAQRNAERCAGSVACAERNAERCEHCGHPCGGAGAGAPGWWWWWWWWWWWCSAE